MKSLQVYTLEEIADHLEQGRYPVSGITPMGTAEFHFSEPACYLGVALHNGNRVRAGLRNVMEVGRKARFREEDPYTERFIESFPLRLIARDSRFEYDLNWEKEKCIYPYEEKKWGLQVWKRPLTLPEIESTHLKYTEFHSLLDMVLQSILRNCPKAILFDMHSFCYLRDGPVNWWEDDKPDINLGTRHILRERFSAEIDLFLRESALIRIGGRTLRVGENALFSGGFLTRKYREIHPDRLLVLAVEYKKIFMDERSGELYPERLEILRDQLLLTKERMLRIIS